ncbi:MAG: Asp-tRNA(Asn)/Glu-tRNA(Gln) amidotransferase subunit GatC [bacterium]|nr:Asp-tRNA(Asn)/Glu-tRNA(Gln) amidotransferase subunit GatC [bacterium]MDZ4260416.1 Asp-tRNA(Asn)/Glu-tRNA(Gln) amidotransferase subunit GatC [Candidatus Sungbacteria bacterium]
MSITQKDVEHIANLARIELNAEEKKTFETELSGILLFAEKLNELDTDGVEPVNGGTVLKNIMREDAQISLDLEGKSAELVDAAPAKKEGMIAVKSVFE